MTLNDFESHSHIASLFKCDFSYTVATISTNEARHAVPL